MIRTLNKKFCPDCYSNKKIDIEVSGFAGVLFLAIAFIPNNFWFLIAISVLLFISSFESHTDAQKYYDTKKGLSQYVITS